MVHTPVPPGYIYKIPGAKAAINLEWEKLELKGTWDMKSVQDQDIIAAKAKRIAILFMSVT